MELYCRNCGNYGHGYKHCRKPIMSYGVVLYNDDNKIIMVERKDSLSYIEFLRGKYHNVNNINYIQLLIDRFSNEEKKRILNYDFNELWIKLWVNLERVNSKIKHEYNDSFALFNKLKVGFLYDNEYITLETLVKKSETDYVYNEWEIPKGRRENWENNKECAIREFNEETNIKSSEYMLINNIIPITEDYIGSNNINYCHIYYIGKMINKETELYIDKFNKNQINEIKDIKWFDRDECHKYIRDYDDHKNKVINDFYGWKNEYKKYGNII